MVGKDIMLTQMDVKYHWQQIIFDWHSYKKHRCIKLITLNVQEAIQGLTMVQQEFKHSNLTKMFDNINF